MFLPMRSPIGIIELYEWDLWMATLRFPWAAAIRSASAASDTKPPYDPNSAWSS
jgi:hypothetical protein